MNILLVGHVCIDENISESAAYTSWGSALMYMHKYFANQPTTNIAALTPYGNDFLEYSEELDIVNKPRGAHTLTYKNVMDKGKRTQKCEKTKGARPVKLTTEIKSYITQADIIVLAPLLPNYSFNYVSELLSFKNPRCLTALLPQGYLRDVSSGGAVAYRDFSEAGDMLPLFDMVFVSRDDLPHAEKVLRSWAGRSPSTSVIMTQDREGASWIKAYDVVRIGTIPIPENKLVDSVGCGDTFSAAAIYHYFCNRDLEAAIQAGNRAAGEKLQHPRPAGSQVRQLVPDQ